MCTGSEILSRELQQGLRAVNLPFLVVYGPRFSGKSALLDEARQLSRQFGGSRRLLCLYLDFRAEWKNPSDPVRQVQGKLIEAASRAMPAFRDRPEARGEDLGQAIAAIADVASATDYWGVLLLWDHFDHLPNEGMRGVCRHMKMLKENRATKAICRKIGIVAASRRNLAWLSDSKDSPFLGYEPILLPARDGDIGPVKMEKRLEAWLAGEQTLLPVVEGLLGPHRNGCCRDLKSLTRRIALDPAGAQLFGEMFLHVVSGSNIREHCEQLLSKVVIAGSRSAMPDYDEFEETGLFVSGKPPARYRFRNDLFGRMAQHCIEALTDANAPASPSGSVEWLLGEFYRSCSHLAISATLGEAARDLHRAWSLAIDEGAPEYYLCFEVQGEERGWMRCRSNEPLGFGMSGDIPPFYRKARDLSARRALAFVHADEERHGIWYRHETAGVVLVHIMASARRPGAKALNESSALHLWRILAKHEELLARLALFEYGRHCLATDLRRTEEKKMPGKGKRETGVDPRKVFIVHGRNHEAKRQIEDLLLRLELRPIEWEEARRATGKLTPSTLETIQAGLKAAQAVIVLMTGDDRARLGEEFNDPEPAETEVKPQPRQNVLIEAGMATALYPDRTLLIEFGPLRPISDFAGLNTVRYDGTATAKATIAQRLKDARCPVNTDGVSWIG